MNVPPRDMMSRHLATVINDLFSFAFETVFSAKHPLTHVPMSQCIFWGILQSVSLQVTEYFPVHFHLDEFWQENSFKMQTPLARSFHKNKNAIKIRLFHCWSDFHLILLMRIANSSAPPVSIIFWNMAFRRNSRKISLTEKFNSIKSQIKSLTTCTT